MSEIAFCPFVIIVTCATGNLEQNLSGCSSVNLCRFDKVYLTK